MFSENIEIIIIIYWNKSATFKVGYEVLFSFCDVRNVRILNVNLRLNYTAFWNVTLHIQ